jgi:hypothetical protein
MTRAERDLALCWIDANAPYHGSYNATPRAFQLKEWPATRDKLIAVMNAAGCVECHNPSGNGGRFEPDWFNFENPGSAASCGRRCPRGATDAAKRCVGTKRSTPFDASAFSARAGTSTP